MDELPVEAAEVFRAEPDRFVASRNELVTRLAAEGRTDEAAAVKALRKPTVAVWALNQLCVLDPEGIETLIDAGAELRAAQRAALSTSKSGADRLRKAASARRTIVATLAGEAAGALDGAGRGGAAHQEVITGALETASIDERAGAALASGTLQRPPAEPGGFGDVFGLASVPDVEPDAKEAPEAVSAGQEPRRKPARPRKDDGPSLGTQVTRLQRDRDAIRRRSLKARQAADGFARELEGMRQRLAKVESKHAEAEAKAGAGELELKRAERELAKATARLEKADGGAKDDR